MSYYKRDIEKELLLWKSQQEHKPLLIRGARQVGKTTTVRKFSKQFKYYIEVNFEQRLDVVAIFQGNIDPKRICQDLSILYNTPIVEGETLLFFDEIQSCKPAISSLRFFFEQMPSLHVIAAGSLLEFALAELPSYGVGRIESLFMYPMSFGEFLSANNSDMLRHAIESSNPTKSLSEPLHQKALQFLKRFLIIGGMPKVVWLYVNKGDILMCQKELDSLILSLEDDFAKYKQRASSAVIREVFWAVVAQNGKKFVFTKAAQNVSAWQVKVGLELLIMAGLIVPVTHSSGNGVPLGTEINPKNRKYLILDTGIFQRLTRLDMVDVILKEDFEAINKGAIAELFVGLELIKAATPYQKQELYYWQREAKSSNAEVDYLVSKGGEILPVEVKSGKKGSMQSLFIFLNAKNIEFGIRTSQENFGVLERVHIYPLYAIANLMS